MNKTELLFAAGMFYNRIIKGAADGKAKYRQRPGPQTACEDLARVICFIFDHAEELEAGSMPCAVSVSTRFSPDAEAATPAKTPMPILSVRVRSPVGSANDFMF